MEAFKTNKALKEEKKVMLEDLQSLQKDNENLLQSNEDKQVKIEEITKDNAQLKAELEELKKDLDSKMESKNLEIQELQKMILQKEDEQQTASEKAVQMLQAAGHEGSVEPDESADSYELKLEQAMTALKNEKDPKEKFIKVKEIQKLKQNNK